MKQCRYCGKELISEHITIGPERLELFYCDIKCNVFCILTEYPDTSLAEMTRTMYPEIAKEFERGDRT